MGRHRVRKKAYRRGDGSELEGAHVRVRRTWGEARRDRLRWSAVVRRCLDRKPKTAFWDMGKGCRVKRETVEVRVRRSWLLRRRESRLYYVQGPERCWYVRTYSRWGRRYTEDGSLSRRQDESPRSFPRRCPKAIANGVSMQSDMSIRGGAVSAPKRWSLTASAGEPETPWGRRRERLVE